MVYSLTKKLTGHFGLQQLNQHKGNRLFSWSSASGGGSSFSASLVLLLPLASKMPVPQTLKARLDSFISFTVPQLTDGPQMPLTDALRVSSRFGGNSPRLGTGQPAEGTLCAKPPSRTGFHLHVKSFHMQTCANPIKAQSCQFAWREEALVC